MAATSADIIQLNVGGVRYETSRSTLTKYGDSMLAAMFRRCEGSEIPPAAVTKDGSYFIDRNGDMFHYVLSFLRNDTLICPTNWGVNEYKELMVEADYYQIGAMVQHINTNIQRLEDDRRVKIKETKHDQDEFLMLWNYDDYYSSGQLRMFGTHETLGKLLDKEDMPTGEEDSGSKYVAIRINRKNDDIRKLFDLITIKLPELGFFIMHYKNRHPDISAKYCKVTDAVAKTIVNREETEEHEEQMRCMRLRSC